MSHQAWHCDRRFGENLTEMHAWVDQNCGTDGWAMTPAGLRGIVNDAAAVYFLDATLAAFRNEMVRRVERRDQRRGVPSAGDRPARRNVAGAHKTF